MPSTATGSPCSTPPIDSTIPVDGLPLGYFITRLLAGRSDYRSPQALYGYLDDVLEAAFTSQTLSSSVLESLFELTGVEEDTFIKMPGRRRDIRAGDLKERYAPLYRRWVEKFGQRYALRSIQAELDSLAWFGKRLCRKRDYKVVVLGHTHEWALEMDAHPFREYVYANTGYWCTPRPTFVEVDKRMDGGFDVWTKQVQQTADEGSHEMKVLGHARV